MSSYSETIVIPFFQKKISELQSIVTVLEANYLVEQQKSKEFSEKLAETSNNQGASIKEVESQLSQLRLDLSKKIKELGRLREDNAAISSTVQNLKDVIKRQEKNILDLEEKNKALERDINVLSKKRKQKASILDGSTF